MEDQDPRAPSRSEFLKAKRRASVERIAGAHLASMDGTMAEALGQSNRQRLVWLSLLAMPLLFPVALPGMASVVGAFCLLIAFGLCVGQPVPLPRWLARRDQGLDHRSPLGAEMRVRDVQEDAHAAALMRRPQASSPCQAPGAGTGACRARQCGWARAFAPPRRRRPP